NHILCRLDDEQFTVFRVLDCFREFWRSFGEFGLFRMVNPMWQSLKCSTLSCVRISATSYLVPLFTLIYLVLFHFLLPSHLDVPCYLNNRQRYCSVWSERLGLFTQMFSN